VNYRKTILHVDDDPELTWLAAERLRPLGYEVTCLNDPAQTLRVLSESPHRLILLAIDMPHFDGLDLLRQIKHDHSDCQVIVLAGLVSMQSLMQSYRWGAELFVLKPLTNIAPLLEAVEAVFRKIDHWWAALDGIRKQRRTVESSGSSHLSPATPKAPASHVAGTAGR
jgi:putative two-component system response regulator